MSNGKEKILQDLQYICGGLTALKRLCDTENKSQAAFYDTFDEWLDILYTTISTLEEDYIVCHALLKNSQK